MAWNRSCQSTDPSFGVSSSFSLTSHSICASLCHILRHPSILPGESWGSHTHLVTTATSIMGIFPVRVMWENCVFNVTSFHPAHLLCSEIFWYQGELGGEGRKAAEDLSGISGLRRWRRRTHCLFVICLPVVLSWKI